MTYRSFTVPFDCNLIWSGTTSTLGCHIFIDGVQKVSFTGPANSTTSKAGIFNDVKQGSVIRFNSQNTISFAGIKTDIGTTTHNTWPEIVSNNITLS